MYALLAWPGPPDIKTWTPVTVFNTSASVCAFMSSMSEAVTTVMFSAVWDTGFGLLVGDSTTSSSSLKYMRRKFFSSED